VKVDYRRFLGRTEERVLAYLGGSVVVAADRGLRVAAPIAPGWWRFSVAGRDATPVARVEAPEEVLRALPPVAGHWSGQRLVHGAAEAESLHLGPEDELPRFAACRARRWHSGELLFERLELEGDAEEEARRAFEDRAPLAGTKGIPGTLRAAFALAVVADVSAQAGVPAAPLEVRARLNDVAEEGWPAAAAVLSGLRREREAAAREATAALARRRALATPQPPQPAPAQDPVERAAAALAGSGASLLDGRRLADGLLEVTYRFMGERFRAVVQAASLQVVDAGVCLSGHDAELTLDSLPSVIREGVEDGHLVMTAHV
jgi:hypothetical protein